MKSSLNSEFVPRCIYGGALQVMTVSSFELLTSALSAAVERPQRAVEFQHAEKVDEAFFETTKESCTAKSNDWSERYIAARSVEHKCSEIIYV